MRYTNPRLLYFTQMVQLSGNIFVPSIGYDDDDDDDNDSATECQKYVRKRALDG